MLVLSRGQDESVMVGNDFQLTVARIRAKRVLIRVSRRNSADRNSGWAESPPAWFENGTELDLGEELFCRIVDIRGDKVRLRFSLPPNVSLHRKEVYEAINRQPREFS
jgi:sRNA-binding carbon storage regulator CsrA